MVAAAEVAVVANREEVEMHTAAEADVAAVISTVVAATSIAIITTIVRNTILHPTTTTMVHMVHLHLFHLTKSQLQPRLLATTLVTTIFYKYNRTPHFLQESYQ